MEISAEALMYLSEANIPKLGKKKNFGGYIVNTRERRERRIKPKVNADFNTQRNRDR